MLWLPSVLATEIGFSRRRYRPHEFGVFHVGGVDLVGRDVGSFGKLEARAIEDLDQDGNVQRGRFVQDLLPLVRRELDLVEDRSTRVVRRDELGRAEELKLYAVGASLMRVLR